MAEPGGRRLSAFIGHRLLARGDLASVRLAVQADADHQPLVLDDETGQAVDLDLRAGSGGVAAELSTDARPSKAARGRPRLGVTAREVTLLPRHWDWLSGQPGGASAALRRLVDQARREGADADATRRAHERVYRAMTTLAGDLADYEEALRALFGGDREGFQRLTERWPDDVRTYVRELWS